MSRRRAARAAGPVVQSPVGDEALVELLLDRDARVWHSRQAYRRFMEARGWALPVRDRLERSGGKWAVESPPEERRECAVEAWARENGVTLPPEPHFPGWQRLDRRRLERMGLVEHRRAIAPD